MVKYAGWAIACALSALILSGLLGGDSDEMVRLRVENDSLKVMQRYQDELVDEANRAAVDARARSLADSLRSDSLLAAVRTRVTRIERETDEMLSSLPDTIRARVEAVVSAERAAHAEERQKIVDDAARSDLLRLGEITSLKAVIARQAETIGTRDRRIANLEAQTRELDPPFLIRLWADMPKYGVGAAVGAVAVLAMR